MYKYLIALALVACWPAAACAQGVPAVVPTQALSLDAALGLVLRHNRRLSSAQHEVLAGDGAVAQAASRPNPELAGLVEDTRQASRVTTLQLNQSLELGGKRAARIGAARRDREAAVAALDAIRAELRAATRLAFVELLAAQAQRRDAQEAADIAAGALAAVAKRVAAGSNSPVDATRSRVAAAGARAALAQAEHDLANTRTALAALWGGEANDIGAVDGDLAALPTLATLEQALAQVDGAPALLRAGAELRRREAGADSERARRMPDLTVSVGARRDEQAGRNQAIFGLALPLPVFDRNEGRLREALERSAAARDDLADARTRLRGELVQAHARAGAALDLARVLRAEILPDATDAFQAARKGFDYGKFDFLYLADAQRTLLDVKARHTRALADVHRAAIDIDRLLGQPAATTR